MKFQIKNRFTSNVQFECELDAEVAGKSYGLKLGFAVSEAIRADANLTGADLTYANLAYANLADANLAGARGVSAPIIPNIDDTILSNIQAPGCSLDMSNWHVCGTTHCRAGWAVHLAGEGGKVLEDRIGTGAAGALIYHASAGYIPDFYASNEAAMQDIVAHAAQQRGEG